MIDSGANASGLQVLDRKVFAEGEKIFREGDSGSRAYIIQRGCVEIIKDIDGEDIVVGSVGPGGIFGEMALSDNQPRMASAIVKDYCVCIIVTSAMFQKKLDGLDPFLGGVLRILVENIRSIQEARRDAQALEAMFECVGCQDDEGDEGDETRDPVAPPAEEDEEDSAFEIG